jgi:phage tail protein X
MTDVIERVRVVSEFSTLSLMIWRRFQRPMPGLVEDTLGRNPGLADLGLYLPVGTEFDLKIEAATTNDQASIQEAIRLW